MFPKLTLANRRHNLIARTKFQYHRAVGAHSYAKGEVRFLAYDSEGNLLEISPTYCNLIVTTGKNLVLDMLFGLSSATKLTSIGVGTENTAAAVGDTKLNPTGGGTVVVQTADAGTIRTSQTVTIASTFGTGVANFIWAETGILNGNTNGTSVLYNRVIIGPFTKTSAVSIVVQFQITQA